MPRKKKIVAAPTPQAPPQPTEQPPLALTVSEFCRRTTISRGQVRIEVLEGRLKVKKVGRRVLVPYTEALRFINAGVQ